MNTKQKFLLQIDKLLSDIESLKKSNYSSYEFKQWYIDTKFLFTTSSEDNPYFLQNFSTIRFTPLNMIRNSTSANEIRRHYLSGLDITKALLSTFRKAIDDFVDEEPIAENFKKSTLGDLDNIFIVHGQDELQKIKLARFISKFDLKPIILHEQPNSGKTIIEKFEKYSEVPCAICLWTGDDLGKLNIDDEPLTLRARQNVIFETGFFIGKLSREKVIILINKDIEIPSDYSGVIYIELDDSDSWQIILAKELKTIGYKIDLNKILD